MIVKNFHITPYFYLKSYKNKEIYFVQIGKNRKSYNAKEFRQLFFYWFNKIKPFLDNNDKRGAIEILLNWEGESLAKYDLYSLLYNYFKLKDKGK